MLLPQLWLTLLFFFFLYCMLDNEVDGEAVDYGLTERMVSYLFEGLFKKQAKFNRFVQQWKETVTVTIEPVPVHSEKATAESRYR